MMRAVILLVAALTAVRGDGCIQRVVGPGRIVCVCNATYCDSAPDIEVHGDEYVVYTSTKSGERLQDSVGKKIFNESCPMSSDCLLTVDYKVELQTILGFGGAMTDAAALNIRKLSNETQQNLIETYYGANGSRYTLCRIPIAGTDFSTRPYTYDDTPNDITLSHFHLVKEDGYKIDFLHQMKSVMPVPGDFKIFTTSWSAPPWMKNTDEITWGSLKHEYYPLYAEYILKFFDAYKERGIDIWGITPGNEPLDGLVPNFPFNAMFWSPTTEAIFTTDFLAPILFKFGYNLVYMSMDDQRFEIPWYPTLIYEDERANNLFNGTAFHWYFDRLFSPTRLDELHKEYPDKFILMTEACAGSKAYEIKVILGSWERGEEYVSDIIQNLSHWTVGWVDWNLALDRNGGPNWAKNFVDSPIIVIPEKDEFYKQPMYYGLSHFSKFVPPGSKAISIKTQCDIPDLKKIAFLTPEKKIVVVAMNKNDNPYNITIQDKNKDGLIYLQLPGKSFITLLYQAPQ